MNQDAKDCAHLSSVSQLDKYNIALMNYRKGYLAASEEYSELIEEINLLKQIILELENQIKLKQLKFDK